MRCFTQEHPQRFLDRYLTQKASLTMLAHIPLFLYPFLNTVTKSRPYESLRLTSLGVIGALVKVCGPVL